jgi:hypothetical protein
LGRRGTFIGGKNGMVCLPGGTETGKTHAFWGKRSGFVSKSDFPAQEVASSPIRSIARGIITHEMAQTGKKPKEIKLLSTIRSECPVVWNNPVKKLKLPS